MIYFIFILLILIIIIYLSYVSIYLKKTLLTISNDKKIIEIKDYDNIDDINYKNLYLTKDFINNLENYFIEDIYKNMKNDIREIKIQDDYFNLFKLAIDSILQNKEFFIKNYDISAQLEGLRLRQAADETNSLKYNIFIPIIKFSKFSIDYDNYLTITNQNDFVKKINLIYPNFNTDPKYFIQLHSNQNNCNRLVHITFLLEEAMKLYKNNKILCNNCILYGKCDNIVPEIVKSNNITKYQDQCKL